MGSRTVMLIVMCVCLAGVNEATKQKSKSVTTLIDAKWDVTPLVLEAAEYLADENPTFLWEFVEAVNGLDPPLASLETDKAQYDVVLEKMNNLIATSQIPVIKLALSLHIYSPKVEMYTQMAIQSGMGVTNCSIGAQIKGKLICDPEDLEIEITRAKNKGEPIPAEEFDIDHHYPGSDNNSIVVILYGELGSAQFPQFHEILKKYSVKGDVDYILRHYVKDRPGRRLRLSGYAVELQIKSTEYKAQDDTKVKGSSGENLDSEEEDEEVEGFNFKQLKSLYPDMQENLNQFRHHLIESSSDLSPLKVWQVQDLSLQAAERILAAPPEEALGVLTHTAQNFPLQARSLIRTAVREELKKEIKENQEVFTAALNVHASDTAIFLNGMYFDIEIVDMVSLLEVVRQELRVIEGLHKIGISGSYLSDVLALDFSRSTSSVEFAIDIRDSAVVWINDIEHDQQYRRWSDSLMELLRPTFPGMLRSVRRNLYHLVVIVDPSKVESQPLLKLAESFYVHSAPLRIGLIFAVNPDETITGLEDAGVAILNAFNYVSENKDPYTGLSFITDIYASVKDERDIKVEDVISALKSKFPKADTEEILGEESAYDTGRILAREFVDRSGFRNLPQVLMNGIPLPAKLLNAEYFEESVLTEIMSQTTVFQKAVYKGELLDNDNTLDFLMNQPHVMPRLNERVLRQDAANYIDMSGKPQNSKPFSTLSARDKTATLDTNDALHYLSNKPTSQHILTLWVVTDLQTVKGRILLNNALQHMKSSGQTRIGLLLNPVDTSEPQHLNRIALSAFKSKTSQPIISILNNEDLAKAVASGEKSISSLNIPGFSEFSEIDDAKFKEILDIHQDYCRHVLHLSSGVQVVVSNGHIIGPLEEGEKFAIDDFSLLERFSMKTFGTKILDVLGKDEATSDMLMKATALLVSRPNTRSRFQVSSKNEDYSVLKLPPLITTEPVFEISVIVDPVSRGAQKVGPILSTLRQILNCNIKVYLNCIEKNSDMPLKNFYRMVLETEPQFDSSGQLTTGPIARFHNMPTSVLLTQNMHVPENWLVESVRSPYDLDNIRLDDVSSGVHSEFELEYLLLEGHCFDASLGNPPRGLQITLGTADQPVMVDTIVMANLGYFQLKANPGAWLLRLRQGRSADIYDIVSHEGTDTPVNSSDIKVLISSFRSHVLKLKVSKKSDKQHLDLLADDDSGSGIWNSITSTFGSKNSDDEVEEKLNIFSVASGHLYERFLRIMMLSVLKNTKTPVKFWFLKNYLSPTLKDYLPHMAKEYNFEYELVQYKWPRWLHQQTEKQRIIWGYKILFLDVLFPLDVRKIIFVDADQVVRADMRELQQLDLGGAPYAYTPFCESRREMDGFRFWKQGYWKNHLQGRRYHISALYVVDLRRFRRIAAGDRLRGQYQALSQDPNSLSNLDQDLPNNMIHQVAIKSLPQEWLWCETWCDDASKTYAKTIDLCNNPQTKEAKLTAAMRILPEWKSYDEEIKRLQRKIEDADIQLEVPSDIHAVHTEL